MIEKRQNEANLPVVLIIDILRLRTNKRGIEQEKRTQFPAGGKGGSNEWRQNSGQWSVVSESGGSGVASESGAFCLLELRVFSTFLNILRLICSGPGYPTQRAGTTSCPRSERFWLLELRGFSDLSEQIAPQFQAMDTQVGPRHRRRPRRSTEVVLNFRRPGVCRGGGDRRPGLAAVPRSPHCLRTRADVHQFSSAAGAPGFSHGEERRLDDVEKKVQILITGPFPV